MLASTFKRISASIRSGATSRKGSPVPKPALFTRRSTAGSRRRRQDDQTVIGRRALDDERELLRAVGRAQSGERQCGAGVDLEPARIVHHASFATRSRDQEVAGQRAGLEQRRVEGVGLDDGRAAPRLRGDGRDQTGGSEEERSLHTHVGSSGAARIRREPIGRLEEDVETT